MADPAQGSLHQGQTVLLDDGLNETQSFKVRILEVALAVETACGAGIAVSTLGGHIVRLIFAGEETTGDGVVDDNVKTVASTGRNQLSLDIAGYYAETIVSLVLSRHLDEDRVTW